MSARPPHRSNNGRHHYRNGGNGRRSGIGAWLLVGGLLVVAIVLFLTLGGE